MRENQIDQLRIRLQAEIAESRAAMEAIEFVSKSETRDFYSYYIGKTEAFERALSILEESYSFTAESILMQAPERHSMITVRSLAKDGSKR